MTMVLKSCLCILAVVALVGCGKAGDPLSPYEAQRAIAKENKTAPPPPPERDKPFILDGLLN